VKKTRDLLNLELEKVRAQKDGQSVELEHVRAQNYSQKCEIANLRTRYEEDASLLKDPVRILRTQRDKFIDEEHVPVLNSQRTAEEFDAVEKIRDSLKLELDSLRARYKEDVTQFQDQLHVLRTQCDQLICEQRVLI
jgi:hypothetical protein